MIPALPKNKNPLTSTLANLITHNLLNISGLSFYYSDLGCHCAEVKKNLPKLGFY